ncbi:MAG TPA: HD domain-containing phosphohydrolase [Gemmatimonadales bacterium]|nr:HD domain-containing phosphohydrolase [Gemmatimonadales bacterium]
MNTAPRFLNALQHALDLRVRPADATVRFTAEETLTSAARQLAEENPDAVFTFEASGIRFGPLPLAGFEAWPWTTTMVSRGIFRLQVAAPPEPAAVAAFLDLAVGLIPPDAPVPQDALRWTSAEHRPQAPQDEYPLDEAVAVVRQLFVGAEKGEVLRRGDVAAVVAALECVLAGEHGPALPLLHTGARERYQPAHALNTALLGMRVADALHLGPDERRECGVAALLHDIGMARLPVPAPDRFTSQDRARVRGHPLEGARLLLREGEIFEGAAIVSYEHHLRQDGSGYPRLNYPREPHVLSRIVAVVDAFDALLAPRSDRPGLDPATALREVERSAVTQFDPRIVAAFSEAVVQAAGHRQLSLTFRQV